MSILLVTTIGHLISALLLAGTGLLVFSQNPSRLLNRMFFFASLTPAVYGTALAIGINLEPSSFAYSVWTINIVNTLLVSSFLHFTFVALNIQKPMRWVILSSYAVSIGIILFALVFPASFIPSIEPKLFTKSYLNAGPLYNFMLVHFVVSGSVSLAALLWAYIKRAQERRKLEYFIVAALFGYGFGCIDFLLVFDIPASPVFGMFFGLYIVPIAYGILVDELLDIRVVFKRALIYSFGIGAITAVLMALILLNNILVNTFPWVQFWTVPIFTAAISFAIARTFWVQLIENERVKYEFITVATHKLRTPLTQISWGVRTLLDQKLDDETKGVVEHIQNSSNRLIELTNILFETTEENTQNYAYTKEKLDCVAVTHATLKRIQPIIDKKKLNVSIDAAQEVFVTADVRRVTSVIEVFIENAVSYTSDDGSIRIAITDLGDVVRYAVTDTGIGISESEHKNIFLRFYRTDAAKRMDTEGVGLGLAMAKSIIEKHGGEIGADSEGENRGSTFWFEIPKV